jgi:RimJ/RimL family protein N-acetyltransferase
MFAWADPRLPRTVCIIDSANAPSLRLAEKLGYRPVTEARYRDATTLLFERFA